jgi:hypothetical protein
VAALREDIIIIIIVIIVLRGVAAGGGELCKGVKIYNMREKMKITR